MSSSFERISGLARVLTGVIPAFLGLAALCCTAARAGDYHLYSCRTPAGLPAPADGWTPSRSGPETFTPNTCEAGGALAAALGQATRTANSDLATWTFTAPPDTTLAGATLWRAGDAAGGEALDATYQAWFAGPAETSLFDKCVFTGGCSEVGDQATPFAPPNEVLVPKPNLGDHIYMRASCGGLSEYPCPEGQHDSHGYTAVVYLYAADLLLEQSAGPSASAVSGELASAATVAGASDVAFTATDPGAGVYEAVFTVDGQVVQRTVLDEENGRCRDAGETGDGLPAFLYAQPCPAALSSDVAFDTTAVANGTHHLVVSVIDAAGNEAPVLDRYIAVANSVSRVPGPPNGAGASSAANLQVSWKGGRGERISSAFGRGETVLGRLTGPGGEPITGARIEVTATPSYAGALAKALPTPVSGADGRFTLRVAGGASSRTLHFAYRSHLGDAAPVASRTLTLSVSAGVRLGVSPQSTAVGQSIRFTGRLEGSPVPHGGKLVVLEARSPGGEWLEFRVIHSDARGRFRAGYRFKFPGPARDQFRAVSESEADYPFAAGSSNVVAVSER
jgi:hypothetical protein